MAKYKIDLSDLGDGIAPGLTKSVGMSLAEAAGVCLEDNNHVCGVVLSVDGDIDFRASIQWPNVNQQVLSAHYDKQDATEDGACGIAIMLMRETKGKLAVRKSWKGKGDDLGHDYWLGDPGSEDALPFAGDTRLEVSGILNGDPSDVKRRLRKKTHQINKSGSQVPGIVIVVLFSRPSAKVSQS